MLYKARRDVDSVDQLRLLDGAGGRLEVVNGITTIISHEQDKDPQPRVQKKRQISHVPSWALPPWYFILFCIMVARAQVIDVIHAIKLFYRNRFNFIYH